MQKIYKINDVALKIRSGMVVTKTTNRNEEKLTNTFVRLLVTSILMTMEPAQENST